MSPRDAGVALVWMILAVAQRTMPSRLLPPALHEPDDERADDDECNDRHAMGSDARNAGPILPQY